MTTDAQREIFSLLGCCEDLHASYTGTSDPLPEGVAETLRAFIRDRLVGWHPSQEWTAAYDAAVRALCEATLAERRNANGTMTYRSISGGAAR